LADLPLVARIDSPPDRRGGDLLVVHAGFHPSWTDPEETLRRVDCLPRNEDWFEKPEVTFATRVRCCTAAGRRSKQTAPPEECNPPFRPWDSWWNGLDRVVHGHWARRGFHRSGRVMGLDSGCVYGGPLTAWCVEEDRVVQVPGEPLR
jgi:bis(5'-nucleosyl)-tetraphosphatase (symmetrical)